MRSSSPMRGKLSAAPWVSSMSPVQPLWDSTESTERPISLVLRLSNSALALGEGAELGGAHRREVLGVGEQDPPAVAEPLVEVDRALGGVGGEVGGGVAESYCHRRFLLSSVTMCCGRGVTRPLPDVLVGATLTPRSGNVDSEGQE